MFWEKFVHSEAQFRYPGFKKNLDFSAHKRGSLKIPFAQILILIRSFQDLKITLSMCKMLLLIANYVMFSYICLFS